MTSNIGVNSISIQPGRKRLRALQQDVVDDLAQQFRNGGGTEAQLQPILVRPRTDGQNGYWLVFGLHRLKAMRKAEHPFIRADETTEREEDALMLKEIRENKRADLSTMEKEWHISEERRLIDSMQAKGRPIADENKSGQVDPTSKDGKRAFDEKTAKATNVSPSSIRRTAARADTMLGTPDPVTKERKGGVPNAEDALRTSLDTPTESKALSELAKKDPKAAEALIERAKQGEVVSARAVLNEMKVAPPESDEVALARVSNPKPVKDVSRTEPQVARALGDVQALADVKALAAWIPTQDWEELRKTGIPAKLEELVMKVMESLSEGFVRYPAMIAALSPDPVKTGRIREIAAELDVLLIDA